MVKGEIRMKATVVNFLIHGSSAKDLYFYSDEYDPKMILSRDDCKIGYFCNHCFTKVISNEDFLEAKI